MANWHFIMRSPSWTGSSDYLIKTASHKAVTQVINIEGCHEDNPGVRGVRRRALVHCIALGVGAPALAYQARAKSIGEQSRVGKMDENRREKKVSPYDQANFVSRTFFWWVLWANACTLRVWEFSSEEDGVSSPEKVSQPYRSMRWRVVMNLLARSLTHASRSPLSPLSPRSFFSRANKQLSNFKNRLM